MILIIIIIDNNTSDFVLFFRLMNEKKKYIYNYFNYKYGWRKQEVKHLDLKIKMKQKNILLEKSTVLKVKSKVWDNFW